MGIAAVWAYSVARPRYGAGPKTAAITALGVWFIGSFLPDLDQWASGILRSRTACEGTLVGLITIIVGSLIGASLYKEAVGAAAEIPQTVSAR